MRAFSCAAAVLGLLLCAPLFAADQADVQKLIDAGKYTEAVGQAAALLRSPNVSPHDQYTLLMLKGDAALCAGQRQLAVSSFTAAGHAATERQDTISAAANLLVAQRAVQGVVKIGDQSYPIADPKQRKEVMQKMADDIMATQARDLRTALEARTLGPIIDIAPGILNMCILEMEANGGTSPNAEPVARTLGKQAQDLIGAELRRLQRDIDRTEQNGYELDTWSGWTARGLSPAQRKSVQDTVPYVDRILKTVLAARRASYALGGDFAAWDRLAAECQDLQQQINTVLSANY